LFKLGRPVNPKAGRKAEVVTITFAGLADVSEVPPLWSCRIGGNHLSPVSDCLFHRLDLARLPAFVEERFERAVQAQNGEPAFFRIGLYPVTFTHALWSLWSEIYGSGAVGTRFGGGRRVALTASARVALRVSSIERVSLSYTVKDQNFSAGMFAGRVTL
jgi:hypothetical protein